MWNCVRSQCTRCRVAQFSMHSAHMSPITHIYYEVTDWDCFMQLWASPWSHNSTNCNIYRIWRMLKYLYTTSLILSFPSSLHTPLWEPASPSASLQNGKCEHRHTQKKYYNTQLQKKAFSLSRSLSLPRSHRSLCDKPDILREKKSSHLFSIVWWLYKGWFLLICSVWATVPPIPLMLFKTHVLSIFHTKGHWKMCWLPFSMQLCWMETFKLRKRMQMFHESEWFCDLDQPIHWNNLICLWNLMNSLSNLSIFINAPRMDFYFHWTMTSISVCSSPKATVYDPPDDEN